MNNDHPRDLRALDTRHSAPTVRRPGDGVTQRRPGDTLRRVGTMPGMAYPATGQRLSPSLFPTSEDVGFGNVWPTLEGHGVLAEAEAAGVSLQIHETGDFVSAGTEGWLVSSPIGAVYHDLERGRGVLVEFARHLSRHQSWLSQRRCVALAPFAKGSWRLWQVAKAAPTLRARFETIVRQGNAAAIAAEITFLAKTLSEAWCRADEEGGGLPCTLDHVGLDAGDRPLFVGLVPWKDETMPSARNSVTAHLVASCFEAGVDAQALVHALGPSPGAAFEFAFGAETHADLLRMLSG